MERSYCLYDFDPTDQMTVKMSLRPVSIATFNIEGELETCQASIEHDKGPSNMSKVSLSRLKVKAIILLSGSFK